MMFGPAHSGWPWQSEHNQLVEGIIFGGAAIYFDEVARLGSIRRASGFLNSSASAVDRQIIQLEESVGLALFERTSKGLRLAAAGELLLGSIRSWRRDLTRTQTQLDDLIGLRRGEVSIALVEGALALFQNGLAVIHAQYPGIVYQVELASALDVVAKVRAGEADLGLAFNLPEIQELRLAETVIYGLGLVVPRSHLWSAIFSYAWFIGTGVVLIAYISLMTPRLQLDGPEVCGSHGELRPAEGLRERRWHL